MWRQGPTYLRRIGEHILRLLTEVRTVRNETPPAGRENVLCTERDATASHDEIARLLNRRGFLRTAAGGSPPRAPADALDTARVGYEFLRSIRF